MWVWHCSFDRCPLIKKIGKWICCYDVIMLIKEGCLRLSGFNIAPKNLPRQWGKNKLSIENNLLIESIIFMQILTTMTMSHYGITVTILFINASSTCHCNSLELEERIPGLCNENCFCDMNLPRPQIAWEI